MQNVKLGRSHGMLLFPDKDMLAIMGAVAAVSSILCDTDKILNSSACGVLQC